MITLKSSDGHIFEIEESVAVQSTTLQILMEDSCTDGARIPLSNITGNILANVIEYCNRHAVNNSLPSTEADPNEHSPSANDSDSTSASASACITTSATVVDDELKKIDEDLLPSWDSDHIKPDSATATSTSIDEDLQKFDVEFINVDWNTIVDYMMAANYLNIRSLLELTWRAAAIYISGKPVEEIRVLFGIENDFTSDEDAEPEAEVRNDSELATN